MKRFVEGVDREQSTLFPECLEDWIVEDNPVRVIDAFVDELDLAELGFSGVDPEATGRPSYHPSVLLKLYIYGYLNRVQSSRRLEREAGRNVEVMWLTGRLVPDHKTIADFRKDNGKAIRKVCARFVELCREIGLLATTSVAIDGSKFKAVNNRDKNFTRAKVERRRAQLEESVGRYLSQLDTIDLHALLPHHGQGLAYGDLLHPPLSFAAHRISRHLHRARQCQPPRRQIHSRRGSRSQHLVRPAKTRGLKFDLPDTQTF